MRILSLAIIGTLCFGIVHCAQTADPRHEHVGSGKSARVDKQAMEIEPHAGVAQLLPRPAAKVHQVADGRTTANLTRLVPLGARPLRRDTPTRSSNDRIPNSKRPVATSRWTTAPMPVGATPGPIRPTMFQKAIQASPTAMPHRIGEIDAIEINTLEPLRQTGPPTANEPTPDRSAVRGSSASVPEVTVPEVKAAVDGVRASVDRQNPGNVRLVGHDDPPIVKPKTSISIQLTDLAVGTLPTSSRRVAQVAGQSEPAEDIGNGFAIPLLTVPASDRATIQKHDDLVTLVATDAELRSVLRMIADHHKLNLVIGPEVAGPVTVSIRGAQLEEVLDAILGVAGFHWHRAGNLLYVTGSESQTLDPKVQGRRLQIYSLNYVASRDVEPVVTRLLSPIGKAFASEASDFDQLKTRELLVVEDNDSGHSRVAQYLAQIDIPPLQVLIEAHVLQIDLGCEERCGVNFRTLARRHGPKVGSHRQGLASDDPAGSSLAFRVAGTDVVHLIEAIHATTNSRTLASPKVSVVNRQTAKVQIGQRLPYPVATMTQTSTIQDVRFLDVGIVLEVTPVITSDGNILMTVLPKVSGGTIAANGFPVEDTTQVSTTVLMPDGSGLVIGGLIRETNSRNEANVPKLGNVPVIKYLFRKKAYETRRNELVIALVTHIMHGADPARQKECIDLQDALPEHAASELRFEPSIRYSNH